jgi:hypothetical protein
MHRISTAGTEAMLEDDLYIKRGSAFELSGSTAGEGEGTRLKRKGNREKESATTENLVRRCLNHCTAEILKTC